MVRTISIFSVFLGIIGSCLSQDCQPVAVCDSKVQKVPECNGASEAEVCLRKVSVDCHSPPDAIEALAKAKYIKKLLCDNLHIQYLFKEDNNECWKDDNFQKGCLTPLANASRMLKEMSTDQKKKTCEELQKTVESCKGGEKENCKKAYSKLLDASLKDVGCDPSSSAVRTTSMAIYVILLLLVVAYSKFRD